MTGDRPVRRYFGVLPLLLAAFGTLLVLIALGGFIAVQEAERIQDQAASEFQKYRQKNLKRLWSLRRWPKKLA